MCLRNAVEALKAKCPSGYVFDPSRYARGLVASEASGRVVRTYTKEGVEFTALNDDLYEPLLEAEYREEKP
jgi:hypothetical protein